MTRILSQPNQMMLFAVSFLLMSGWWLFSAQAETLRQKEARFDALYMQLLDNPADVDATLAYSTLAVEMGDYEAAIPPLERLLITNPNATKIKLELGIMYYMLGSMEAAKTYFTEVKADEANSPELARQAESYLQRI